MNLTETHIEDIKQLLQNGQSKEDFVSLINFVIQLQNVQLQTTYNLISANKIEYYLSKRDDKYTNFEIPKKSGGIRNISSPDGFLKKVQRRVAFVLEALYTPNPSVNGFVTGRSIVSNAKGHIGRKYVYNIDLKDFFSTIHYGRIKGIMQIPPFNASLEIAHLIAHFSCYKGVLPQGSPLSPILTNIVCQSLDYHLVKLAKHYRCFYSRYADDITFSSDKNLFVKEKFVTELNSIITKQGFEINEKKTRLQKYTQRQEVTGIIVNNKPNLKRDYIKKVRAMLHNWESKGLEYCQAKLIEEYPKEKGFIRNKVIPPFESVLNGKILFLGMVRGKEDSCFKKFEAKYNELSQAEETIKKSGRLTPEIKEVLNEETESASIDNITEEEFSNINKKFKNLYEGLKVTLDKKPTFKELIEYLIKENGKVNTKTTFNLLKQSWTNNKYPKTNFTNVYDNIFIDTRALANDLMNSMIQENKTFDEVKEENNEILRDVRKKSSATVDIDENGILIKETEKEDEAKKEVKKVKKKKDTDKTEVGEEETILQTETRKAVVSINPRAAFLSQEFTMIVEYNSDRSIKSVEVEDEADTLNESANIESIKLLDSKVANPGEIMTIKIPDNYEDIIVNTWEDVITKGPLRTFKNWITKEGIEEFIEIKGERVPNPEYINKIPMIAYDKNNIPLFFIHDTEWYNPLNVGYKGLDETAIQYEIITKAQEWLNDIRTKVYNKSSMKQYSVKFSSSSSPIT